MLVDRVDLAAVLRAAAAGRFPPADGRVSRTTPWRDGVEAAVALTGHAVLAVGEDVSDERLVGLGAHGFGKVHDPRLVVALAGEGQIGVLDVLLVGAGTADPDQMFTRGCTTPVVPRADLAHSERAVHAGQWRDDVQVLGLPDDPGVATLARGIAGLTEVGIQTSTGSADTLLEEARALVARGEVLLASVTPGNARSLRFFLRRGFVPVGSVQQWQPRRAAAP